MSLNNFTKVATGKALKLKIGAEEIESKKLTIGVDGLQYVLPETRGAEGQILQTDGNGTVSWVNDGNFKELEPNELNTETSTCYINSYIFGNSIPTTFPTPKTTWQPILTNIPIALETTNEKKHGEWSVVDSAIKWNANAPRSIRVKVICSFTQTGGAVLAPREFGIFKGNPANTVIASSKQIVGVEAVGSSFPVNTTLVCITTLAPDDILQLKVSNPDSSQFDVLIPDMSYVITEL